MARYVLGIIPLPGAAVEGRFLQVYVGRPLKGPAARTINNGAIIARVLVACSSHVVRAQGRKASADPLA